MAYRKNSAYANTPISSMGDYLDQLVTRDVPISSNDSAVEITAKYNLRPDLMAYDLYGDPNLWWVFAERNPNSLKDPVGDFRVGLFIFVPNKSNLLINLGL
jgi:hypothetical protein